MSQKHLPWGKGGERRGSLQGGGDLLVLAASFQPRGLAFQSLGCETEGCGGY